MQHCCLIHYRQPSRHLLVKSCIQLHLLAAVPSEMSLDCCEYDLAVFVVTQEDNQANQVVQVDNRPVELMHITGSIKDHIIDLADMVILKDNSKLMLSSAAKDIISEKYKKMLAASGKKLLINSLFCQQKMRGTKHPIVAAMWLKICSLRVHRWNACSVGEETNACAYFGTG